MPLPHLVIHYNRSDSDYNFCHLILSPSAQSFQQCHPQSRTSFGAVFRLPLTAYPKSIHFIDPSNPTYDFPRPLPDRSLFSPASDSNFHIFVSHRDPHILPSPHPHLSPVLLPPLPNRPFLVAFLPHPLQVFPASHPYATPQSSDLFFVDTYSNPTPSLTITDDLIPPPSASYPILQSSPAQFLPSDPPSLQKSDIDVIQLIISQTSRAPRLSRLIPTLKLLPLSPSAPPVIPNNTHLRIYHTRLQNDVKNWTILLLSPTGTPFPETPVLSTDLYKQSAIFTVDLSKLPPSVQDDGFLITAVPLEAGKAYKPMKWTRKSGLHVVLAQSFPMLQTPSQADVMLYYHRFDDFNDWDDWQLHVWSEDYEQYPAMSTIVHPQAPHRSGVISFDLTSVLFPFGAKVYAEPEKTILRPEETIINEFGESVTNPAYRESYARDVKRSWVYGSISELHFIQGDTTPHHVALERKQLLAKKRFRIRYRRHLPNDYSKWDLWTWDEHGSTNSKLAIAPEQGEARAYVDFTIDRSLYGSGSRIGFIPRKGGKLWTAQDGPARVWSAELLENTDSQLQLSADPVTHAIANIEQLPTFITTESSDIVLHRLEEVKSMLTAQVETENTIHIRSPVPISWISPPRRGRLAVSATSIRLTEQNAQSLVNSCDDVRRISGQDIHFRKMREVSHIETQLVFRGAPFHEDFLIENVVVAVPGFDIVPLTWHIERDWDKYLYKGPLGWEYTKKGCSFRCFSPTADNVSVVLYESHEGDKGRTVVPMRRIPEGCWKAFVHGDLRGKYYKLLAEGENKQLFPGVEIIDPYSKCNSSHAGRGYIFGNETTPICPRPNIPPSETIVYELHIRDATIEEQSGVSKRGKFLGLTERNTRMKYRKEDIAAPPLTHWTQEEFPGLPERSEVLELYSTGLDHIVQMGVNAIQIMPIQDFDNDESDETSYKWGYMPVHFNSPDGWYATRTTCETRITEFKKLVDACHSAGLKVIMDVVYNHTAEDTNESNLDARFSFNGIAPRYYYRTCGNTPVAYTGETTCAKREAHEPRCGMCYSNGSGCGNEFRSEAPMARKFIIDSLKYWVNEYQVDGFRLDLLGLIDIETLSTAVSQLREIDPNIIVYGEPWCGGLTPIRITDKGSQRSLGFAVFNDSFRDALRGSSFNVEETFVMDGGRTAGVKSGIIGSVDTFCDSPLETINYVECHDNYTLWDHMRHYIRHRIDDIKFTEEDMRRMHRLAAVAVFTSQGIPFMQLGQEMCRTKFDDENSYESPDEINMVRWEDKVRQWTTVQYYRGLILLRRSHPEIFCKETKELVHSSITFFEDLSLPVPERCIAYQALGDSALLLQRLSRTFPGSLESDLVEESLKWSAVVVLFNPTPLEATFTLPGYETDQVWLRIVDAKTAGIRDIGGPFVGSIGVEGRSASVLRQASVKDKMIAQLDLRLASVSDSYASFHGDDLLTRYAVGLDQTRSPQEAEENKILLNERICFERRREEPLLKLGKTEAEVIAALDVKYGKHNRVTIEPQCSSG